MTSNPTQTPPAPDTSAHDEYGRLVAVSWSSHAHAHAGEGGGRCNWLVAIDGSECSLRAVSMAVRLVEGTAGAVMHLVHVHPWLVKEAAEGALPQRGWSISAAARELLDRAGVGWCMHVRMGEAATEIISLAASLGSRGIVIGSRGLTAAQSLMLGSVAYKVVHLGKVPVLVVR